MIVNLFFSNAKNRFINLSFFANQFTKRKKEFMLNAGSQLRKGFMIKHCKRIFKCHGVLEEAEPPEENKGWHCQEGGLGRPGVTQCENSVSLTLLLILPTWEKSFLFLPLWEKHSTRLLG